MDLLWTRGREEKIAPKKSEPFKLRLDDRQETGRKQPIFHIISNPFEFLKEGIFLVYLHIYMIKLRLEINFILF